MADIDRTLFDRLSVELIDSGKAQPGTMMGFPCLKLRGSYFACMDKSNNALVIKLTEERVKALVAAGEARIFTPAGQLFKQWAVMEFFDETLWRGVLREARKLADEA